jgi:hypothetical protein
MEIPRPEERIMAMSPEAQAEYNRAMAAATVKHGSIVRTNGTFYGWSDYDAAMHVAGWSYTDKSVKPCPLVVPEHGTVREDEWSQFEGTFYDGDTTHHGVTVTGVSCSCGQLTDRTVRWEANMQEVAEAIFEIAFGPKAPAREF